MVNLILKIKNPTLIKISEKELESCAKVKKKAPHNSDIKAGKKKVLLLFVYPKKESKNKDKPAINKKEINHDCMREVFIF